MVKELADQLVVVPYNRPDLLEQAFFQHGNELAAVICEPIYYNAGCVLPSPEFMHALRRLSRERGVLLVFDEVLSAFRMCPGGAQQYLGVTPDLCTLGKAVGGGFPLSAFGGRRDIMRRLMPEGDCQHSGTYNGHPVPVAAGLAAVRPIARRAFTNTLIRSRAGSTQACRSCSRGTASPGACRGWEHGLAFTSGSSAKFAITETRLPTIARRCSALSRRRSARAFMSTITAAPHAITASAPR